MQDSNEFGPPEMNRRSLLLSALKVVGAGAMLAHTGPLGIRLAKAAETSESMLQVPILIEGQEPWDYMAAFTFPTNVDGTEESSLFRERDEIVIYLVNILGGEEAKRLLPAWVSASNGGRFRKPPGGSGARGFREEEITKRPEQVVGIATSFDSDAAWAQLGRFAQTVGPEMLGKIYRREDDGVRATLKAPKVPGYYPPNPFPDASMLEKKSEADFWAAVHLEHPEQRKDFLIALYMEDVWGISWVALGTKYESLATYLDTPEQRRLLRALVTKGDFLN
jgi:hypothetical protein